MGKKDTATQAAKVLSSMEKAAREAGGRRGPVRVIGHSLVDEGGPFLGLGVSYFTALWRCRHDPQRLDSIALKTAAWCVAPFAMKSVYSSYFADETRFPRGSVRFDHALLMKNINHEWQAASDVYL